LIVTRIADQDFISSRHDPAASDTLRSRGPAKPFQQLSTASIIGEARHEIYQSHSRHHEKASQRNQETSAKEDQGGLTYRLCRGLTGRSARCGVRRTETNPVPAWTPAKHTGRFSQVDSHARNEDSRLGLPHPYRASSRAIGSLLGQSLQTHHKHADLYVSVASTPRLRIVVVLPDRDGGIQVAARIRAIREGLTEFDKFHDQSHSLVALHHEQFLRSFKPVLVVIVVTDEIDEHKALSAVSIEARNLAPKLIEGCSGKVESPRSGNGSQSFGGNLHPLCGSQLGLAGWKGRRQSVFHGLFPLRIGMADCSVSFRELVHHVADATQSDDLRGQFRHRALTERFPARVIDSVQDVYVQINSPLGHVRGAEFNAELFVGVSAKAEHFRERASRCCNHVLMLLPNIAAAVCHFVLLPRNQRSFELTKIIIACGRKLVK